MSAIVLIGLMGAGKSTVARCIAERSGRHLVDTDTAIEATTGQTVRELWESGGEAAYRALESDVVLDALASDDPVVIAAPGGVVLDLVVRTALADATVVWLRADPEVLAGRVQIGDHRPLLDDDPLRALTAMALDRAELYAGVADGIVDVDRLDPEQAADAVLALYPAASGG